VFGADPSRTSRRPRFTGDTVAPSDLLDVMTPNNPAMLLGLRQEVSMAAVTNVAGRVSAAIAVVLATAVQAGAQAPATSFEELRLLVKPGDALEITERTGRQSSGRLGDLGAVPGTAATRNVDPLRRG
jgi:hypothetical protein